MYNYNEQLQIVNDIILKENDYKRFDCPFCAGKNTFTIANKEGDVLWNCYKAKCNARGIKKGTASNESIRNRLNRIPNTFNKEQLKNSIPEILSDINFHPEVLDWLKINGCLEQALNKSVKIKYSPLEKRILFFYEDDVGAIGRTLIPTLKPKWKVYGDCSGLFVAGKGDLAVVVEDCASAISISRIKGVIGIALAGTSISSKQKHLLTTYNNIIICLDKDASYNAISLMDVLKPFTNVTIELLEKDLKCLNVNELKEKFKRWLK